MSDIPFEDFKKLDIRVGKILAAEDIPNSEKLIRLQVDFGNEQRQAVAGLKKVFTPDELVGKKFIFVTNLERRKMMGVESQCMILAAEDENGKIVLLQPAEDIELGSKIR